MIGIDSNRVDMICYIFRDTRYKIHYKMTSLSPKELVSLLNIIEEDLTEKNSLEK